MKIYTVALQRGGTGKTTTAAALAQAAEYSGQKSLVIDMDPQGNLTYTMGGDANKKNVFDFINGARASQCVQHLTEYLDIIPAAWSLSTLQTESGNLLNLKTALDDIKAQYDFIMIDTPATAGPAQYMAINAAEGVIIPLECEVYSIQSFYQTINAIKRIRTHNNRVNIKGFVLSQPNYRSLLVKEMKKRILEIAQENNIVYLGDIRTGVAVKESQLLQKNLFEYAPKSNPAIDYMAIYNQL